MTVSMRKYGGADDLRAMQELAQRVWSTSGPHHVGDLAWGRFMFPAAQVDWPIALWESGGRVVAWAWAQLPDDLRLQVDPEHPGLLEEVLDWFDGLAGSRTREINPLDAQGDVRKALLRRGYEALDDEAPFFAYHEHELDDLQKPVVPQGFTVRAVRGSEDLDRRVAVHRAAWNPSRVTPESYSSIMAAWPYRTDLDWVVEAPDGRFAANCLVWYDDVNRVGLIEPVGTDPEFRRLGLARAVCLAALHALAEAGGERAVVCPRGDAAYPIPQVLYRSIGFRPYGRSRTYRKA
ncbi:GNAT family N-acetyltransferase [Streptosporangium sp. NPDC051023]|uniref:GNAT family N-acetyltransferase n=1 Tax=Streptosporangium sp. NPDC051023 TaxID=3155410 RepID=UPI00344F4B4B